MRSVSFDLKAYSRTFSVSKPIDEVFNVLNDVEDYQSFIPFCSESKIIEQTQTVIKASLVLSFLNTSTEFISENEFKKNDQILISVKKNLKGSDVEALGAQLFNFVKKDNIKNLSIYSESINGKPGKDFIGRFIHGLKLKSYEFNKYKTKKEKKII